MARTASLLLAGLVVPALVVAQGAPRAEIGTSLGLTIRSVDHGSSVVHLGVPGQGILSQPTIYATLFAGKAVMVEPQIALNIISSEGRSATTVGLGGQVGYLFKTSTTNAPFLAVTLVDQYVSLGGASHNELGLGGKFGYRAVVGTSVGLRVEAGYRRWKESRLNELTFGMGIGAIVHGS